MYANLCTYYLHIKVDNIGTFCISQEKKICQNTLKHNVLHIIGKSQKAGKKPYNLLSVNADFEGKHNDKIDFLFTRL